MPIVKGGFPRLLFFSDLVQKYINVKTNFMSTVYFETFLVPYISGIYSQTETMNICHATTYFLGICQELHCFLKCSF